VNLLLRQPCYFLRSCPSTLTLNASKLSMEAKTQFIRYSKARLVIFSLPVGTEIGKEIMKAAAKHLTLVTLELGVRNSVVVTEDADLELAATRILWAKFAMAGQTCFTPNQVFVHESVYPHFTNAVKKVRKTYILPSHLSSYELNIEPRSTLRSTARRKTSQMWAASSINSTGFESKISWKQRKEKLFMGELAIQKRSSQRQQLLSTSRTTTHLCGPRSSAQSSPFSHTPPPSPCRPCSEPSPLPF
jgi:hypothetical protein